MTTRMPQLPDHDVHHDHDDFGGLQRDLPRLFDRRVALKVLAGAGLLTLVGCSSSSNSSTDGGTTDAATTAASTAAATDAVTTSTATDATADTSALAVTTSSTDCAVIPTETAGPFPGDGSNGANVLAESGVVRSDIRNSIGSASGTAEGVPLTVKFQLVDTKNNCKPLVGAAVYTWHCDRDGNYSMYSAAAANENYLRGVQDSDANGTVTFQSIFPAAYPRRWPHIHFEVYGDVGAAVSSGTTIATSQIALPKDTCDLVYATAGYEASVSNMQQSSLQSDGVFSDDGGIHELGTITGTIASGLTVMLLVPV